MYKNILFLFVALMLAFSVSFVRVELLETGEKTVELAKYNSDKEKENCEGLFGDPDDDESFAHLLQIAFTIMKFAGPLLCIIFSGIEFVKAVVSDDKDALSKATKKSLIRVVLAMVLFFIPVVVDFLFPLLGFYGTCGIS
jgi:hypothetical protein